MTHPNVYAFLGHLSRTTSETPWKESHRQLTEYPERQKEMQCNVFTMTLPVGNKFHQIRHMALAINAQQFGTKIM